MIKYNRNNLCAKAVKKNPNGEIFKFDDHIISPSKENLENYLKTTLIKRFTTDVDKTHLDMFENFLTIRAFMQSMEKNPDLEMLLFSKDKDSPHYDDVYGGEVIVLGKADKTFSQRTENKRRIVEDRILNVISLWTQDGEPQDILQVILEENVNEIVHFDSSYDIRLNVEFETSFKIAKSDSMITSDPFNYRKIWVDENEKILYRHNDIFYKRLCDSILPDNYDTKRENLSIYGEVWATKEFEAPIKIFHGEIETLGGLFPLLYEPPNEPDEIRIPSSLLKAYIFNPIHTNREIHSIFI